MRGLKVLNSKQNSTNYKHIFLFTFIKYPNEKHIMPLKSQKDPIKIYLTE
jgi:hypothetical protein